MINPIDTRPPVTEAPEVTVTPEAMTPAPTYNPQPTSDPERAVYDGDVSDTYLAKLSAYYNEHAKVNTPYMILRSSQYHYILVYGDTSNYRNWSNATVCEITLSGNYYTQAVFDVTEDVGYTTDPTGDTAFIYSSSSDFLPSRYINNGSKITPFFTYAILVIAIIVVLYRFIIRILGIKR